MQSQTRTPPLSITQPKETHFKLASKCGCLGRRKKTLASQQENSPSRMRTCRFCAFCPQCSRGNTLTPFLSLISGVLRPNSLLVVDVQGKRQKQKEQGSAPGTMLQVSGSSRRVANRPMRSRLICRRRCMWLLCWHRPHSDVRVGVLP